MSFNRHAKNTHITDDNQKLKHKSQSSIFAIRFKPKLSQMFLVYSLKPHLLKVSIIKATSSAITTI